MPTFPDIHDVRLPSHDVPVGMWVAAGCLLLLLFVFGTWRFSRRRLHTPASPPTLPRETAFRTIAGCPDDIPPSEAAARAAVALRHLLGRLGLPNGPARTARAFRGLRQATDHRQLVEILDHCELLACRPDISTDEWRTVRDQCLRHLRPPPPASS